MPVCLGSPGYSLVVTQPSVERRAEIRKRGGRVVGERAGCDCGIVTCVLLHIERVGRAIEFDACNLEQPAVCERQIRGLILVENEQLATAHVSDNTDGFEAVGCSVSHVILALVEKVFVAIQRVNPEDVAHVDGYTKRAAVRDSLHLLVIIAINQIRVRVELSSHNVVYAIIIAMLARYGRKRDLAVAVGDKEESEIAQASRRQQLHFPRRWFSPKLGIKVYPTPIQQVFFYLVLVRELHGFSKTAVFG